MWWTVVLNFLDKIKWYAWVIGVLAASNLFTYAEWRHTSALLHIEKSVHAQDISNFRTAQATADAAAQAEKTVLLQESKTNAAKADASYSALLTQYHTNLLRYSTHQGATKQADSDQLSTTKGSDGPSESTNLPSTINISSDDAQVCAVNTARLQAVHDWAVSLPK